MNTYEDVVQFVMLRAPAVDEAAAATMVERVVPLLCGGLPKEVRLDLSQAVPGPMGDLVRSASDNAIEDLDGLVAALGPSTEQVGLEREHVQVVSEALGRVVPPPMRTRLQRHFPAGLAELLTPIQRASAPVTAAPMPQPDHTLAAGHPGSDHPVAGDAGHSAHRHSIAESDDPHADRKLSSGD